MILIDWKQQLADTIAHLYGGDAEHSNRMHELINSICPFKSDTVYMPLGDVIAVLKNSGINTECGACMEVAMTGVTTNAHTCTPRPSPLLQCIDCKNTESPAGAMARMFNHGRCVHCGGVFKVIRA